MLKIKVEFPKVVNAFDKDGNEIETLNIEENDIEEVYEKLKNKKKMWINLV